MSLTIVLVALVADRAEALLHHHLGEAENGVQRRADFVADAREKLGLARARLLRRRERRLSFELGGLLPRKVEKQREKFGVLRIGKSAEGEADREGAPLAIARDKLVRRELHPRRSRRARRGRGPPPLWLARRAKAGSGNSRRAPASPHSQTRPRPWRSSRESAPAHRAGGNRPPPHRARSGNRARSPRSPPPRAGALAVAPRARLRASAARRSASRARLARRSRAPARRPASPARPAPSERCRVRRAPSPRDRPKICGRARRRR